MFFIINYTIEQTCQILENLRNNNDIEITDTPHYIHKSERKHCKYEWGYDLLKNIKPSSIQYSKDNKFKLIFKHPESQKYNLVLVIFIINETHIRLITTHPERRKK